MYPAEFFSMFSSSINQILPKPPTVGSSTDKVEYNPDLSMFAHTTANMLMDDPILAGMIAATINPSITFDFGEEADEDEDYDADKSTASSPATSSASCSRASHDGNIGIFDAIYKSFGGKGFEDDEEGEIVGPAFHRTGRNQYGVHSPAPAWWTSKKDKVDDKYTDDKVFDQEAIDNEFVEVNLFVDEMVEVDTTSKVQQEVLTVEATDDRIKRTNTPNEDADEPRYRGYVFEYGYHCPVWVREDSPEYWPKGDPLPVVWDKEFGMWATWEPRQNWPAVSSIDRDEIFSGVLKYWFDMLRGSDDEEEDGSEEEYDSSMECGSDDEVFVSLMAKVERFLEDRNDQVAQEA